MVALMVFYIILKTFVSLRKRGFLPAWCRARRFSRIDVATPKSAMSQTSRLSRFGHATTEEAMSTAMALTLRPNYSHAQRPYPFAYGASVDKGSVHRCVGACRGRMPHDMF